MHPKEIHGEKAHKSFTSTFDIRFNCDGISGAWGRVPRGLTGVGHENSLVMAITGQQTEQNTVYTKLKHKVNKPTVHPQNPINIHPLLDCPWDHSAVVRQFDTAVSVTVIWLDRSNEIHSDTTVEAKEMHGADTSAESGPQIANHKIPVKTNCGYMAVEHTDVTATSWVHFPWIRIYATSDSFRDITEDITEMVKTTLVSGLDEAKSYVSHTTKYMVTVERHV